MEIDAINSKLASRSTTALEQQRLAITNRPSRALDLSQEHTNGRMFEQAVQNANKAGETAGGSSDNVKLSNSKIDGNADARNENPLTLNQKDARIIKEDADPEVVEEKASGETCLKQALKVFGVNYEALCQLSHDTVFVKGKAIDALVLQENENSTSAREDDLEPLKIGASSNLSDHQIKRQKVFILAEQTYHDIAHLEAEEGHAFETSIIQGLDEAVFAKEVVSLIFDRPFLFLQEKSSI